MRDDGWGRMPQSGEAKLWLRTRKIKKAKTTPLRNEAQLNCVSLRSELDCEVSCRAVKGQDERPLRGALDSPATHHRTVYADVEK